MMVPTQRTFQENIFMLVYPSYPLTLRNVLFVMQKTTVRLVSKLVPTGDTNLKALSKSITRLLTTVKDMKKQLNRTWD